MPLTRSQVAQRLGRSIATVRALEEQGVLRPARGPRGHRFFDVDQVDQVIAEAASTGRVLAPVEPDRFQGRIDPAANVAKETRRELIAARRQIAALESNEFALRAELEFVRAQVLEVVEELLDTAPRRASVLAALERLLSIAR